MENKKLGSIGLYFAILGMILPIIILLVFKVVLATDFSRLGALLFIACEVAALGCGFVGRQSGAGKASVIISAASLVLFMLLYVFVFDKSVESTPSSGLNTESAVSTTDE